MQENIYDNWTLEASKEISEKVKKVRESEKASLQILNPGKI